MLKIVPSQSTLKLGHFAMALSLAVICLFSSGCVRRRMTIRTTPPGAQVFVDDQEIGTTPCSASYVYYGTRKLTIMKDGYKTETIYQRFSPPWYQIPPLDFITENLLVNEIRDERIVDVQLLPEEIVPQAKLIERAQALRDSATSGQITPLIIKGGSPAPPAPALSFPGQGLPGGEPIPRYPLPAPPLELRSPVLPDDRITPLPPVEGQPDGPIIIP